MPTELAAATLGVLAPAPLADGGCQYWVPDGAPAGLSFMIEAGHVVRADVEKAGIPTVGHLQVGSTVAAVREVFGSSLTAMPHKYKADQGWQYLMPVLQDVEGGVIFEVDGTSVQNYRVGQLPQLQYVEKCG